MIKQYEQRNMEPLNWVIQQKPCHIMFTTAGWQACSLVAFAEYSDFERIQGGYIMIIGFFLLFFGNKYLHVSTFLLTVFSCLFTTKTIMNEVQSHV